MLLYTLEPWSARITVGYLTSWGAVWAPETAVRLWEIAPL